MLKRLSHILLSSLLLIATMGVAVSKHYCGDELVAVSIKGDVDSCCDMQGGCCHDESQTFQLKVDYTAPAVISDVHYFSFVVYEIPTILIDFEQKTNPTTQSFAVSESPPIKDVSQFLCNIQTYRL